MPTRYYDEDEERLKKVKNKYADENSKEEYKPTANFRKEWNKKNARPIVSKDNKSSNIRLLVIIGVLLFAAWYLLIRNNNIFF